MPDGRRYLKAVPLFLFISWINKAGTVNDTIVVGMGRKTKNETRKKGNTLHADLRIKYKAADIAALLLYINCPGAGSFIFWRNY
ncbi:hypothetical protein LNP17_25600 [Klebsiella variicola subsp. variicola]|nr:hypothetical protein [Klebsiella variicola subsp. variicola]